MPKIIKQNINFLFCLLLLMVSGNPIIVSSANVREIYLLIAFLVLVCTSVRKVQFFSRFVNYASVFIAIFLLQIIAIPGISFNSQLFALIRIFIGVGFFCLLGKNFVHEYIRVMTFLSGISLVCYSYTLLIGPLPGIPITRVVQSLVLYTQMVHDDIGLIQRNCGMFWEPGAYQGYLNIGIAFALLSAPSRERTKSLVLMIIALLTTQSTTGYVALGFSVIFYIYNFSRMSSGKRFFTSIIVCVIVVYMYYRLDFLAEKINTNLQDTDSAQGRVNDYVRFSSLIAEYFLTGINFGEIEVVSGNGFVVMILYYGIIGAIYYVIRLWKNISSQLSSKIALYLFGVVLITLQGEVFIFYPLYLTLPIAAITLNEKKVAQMRIRKC